MIEYFVLIIILLILIFFGIIYYFLFNNDIKLISEKTNVLNTVYEHKIMSIYSDKLKINKNKVNVIYYDIPINCTYWTIGIYNDGKCINSINMGKYHANERGDTLAILITNNYTALDECKKIICEKHKHEYIYKKLITQDIYSETDYYIKFESFSNNFNKDPKFFIKEYIFDDVPYKKFNNKALPLSRKRLCENINLFNRATRSIQLNDYQKINVSIDTNERDSSLECLTNRSDIIDISKINNKTNHIRILAIDHFKSRSALHSNIIFFDAETNKKIDFEITGKISDLVNNNETITFRDIKYELPKFIKFIYIIEYIYFDYETGSKTNSETIIPMQVYI